MSIKLMTMVFDPALFQGTADEVLLALAMADHANDAGEGIYPSLSTLAGKTRRSDSSVRRGIKGLLESGWLIRVNSGTGGRGVTNEYRINPEWIKGAKLTGFQAPGAAQQKTAAEVVGEADSGGSRPAENPSSMVTGFQDGKGSNLTGYSGERVSDRPQKGVTAVVPESSEPKNSDARAQARRGARAQEPGPEPSPATHRETVGRFWHGQCLIAFQDCWSNDMDLPDLRRRRFDQLPDRLRVMISSASPEIVNRLVEAELEDGQRNQIKHELLREMVRKSWEGIRTIPLSGKAAAA